MTLKTDRIWLKNYPAEVPAEIDSQRFSSLAELFEQCFKTYPHRTAQTFMGKKFSYAQIDQFSMNIASYLQSVGLKKGDRVAIMMPNIPQYPVIATAILRAGFILVNVNPLYTARELEHQLKDADVQAIFIAENFAHTLAQAMLTTPVRHVILTGIGDLIGGLKGWFINKAIRFKGMVPNFDLPNSISLKEALLRGEYMLPDYQQPEIGSDDIAILQYTGGTTGVSKGATLLHRNLVSNVLQVYAWILPALKTNLSGKDQIVLVGALPLYHIFAFNVNLLITFYLGGNNILIPNPRDLSSMLRELRRQPFHVLPAVNTLFNAIVNHPEASSVNWSSLCLSVGGGMALQQATVQAWYKLTGCGMVEGYGMSETSPVICASRVDITDVNDQRMGIGYPVPSTTVVLRDDNDQPVPLGTPGEITVQGPQVMAGYWNSPEETAKVMTKDGFFRTGDIAVMDESGWIRIVDRKKDMILVSGFNVYPNEIEDVVALMSGVEECVAIGVPSPKSGEAVMVLVVKKDPELTEEQVKQWCKTRLTGYKRPRFVVFRESLPKSTVGKILRRELRALLSEPADKTPQQ
jgi:long-chain acyl-CoA synthetase